MSLEQFTYTGSPWGYTAPGWTVFQHSRGISPKEAVELKLFFQFKDVEIDDVCVIDNRPLPIKYAFVVNPRTGRRIICQSLNAGLRWYDQTRGRDYFAHVFTESSSGEELVSATGTFNPMAWFLSPSFQVEFPGELKEKALQILYGEQLNEPPPELPALASAEQLEQNLDFTDGPLFSRLCDYENAIGKIGRLCAEMARRILAGRKEPLFFDGTKSAGIDSMAAAVRLLPLSVRTRISFCTWLSANELRIFPAVEELLFIGTIRSGERADRDIGLYGVLPQDGPVFRTLEELELFRRMVDSGGLALSERDFDALVLCWKVASGQTLELDALRMSFAFAKAFPGVQEELELGLSRLMSDCPSPMVEMVSSVLWFELGMPEFEGIAKQACSICVQDFEMLNRVIQSFADDEPRISFLNAVASEVISSDVTSFVKKLLDAKWPWENLAMQLPEDNLIRITLEYRRIQRDLSAGCFVGEPENALGIVHQLLEIAGTNVEDILEVKKSLEYRQDIARIKRIDDIEPVLRKYVETGFPKGVDLRKDILDKTNAVSIHDVVRRGMALEALGLNGVETIYGKWNEDQIENSRLKRRIRELESSKKRIRLLFAVFACAIGIVIGFFVGKKFGGAKSAQSKPVLQNDKNINMGNDEESSVKGKTHNKTDHFHRHKRQKKGNTLPRYKRRKNQKVPPKQRNGNSFENDNLSSDVIQQEEQSGKMDELDNDLLQKTANTMSK